MIFIFFLIYFVGVLRFHLIIILIVYFCIKILINLFNYEFLKFLL